MARASFRRTFNYNFDISFKVFFIYHILAVFLLQRPLYFTSSFLFHSLSWSLGIEGIRQFQNWHLKKESTSRGLLHKALRIRKLRIYGYGQILTKILLIISEIL